MTKYLLAMIVAVAMALAGCTAERHDKAFDGLDSLAGARPEVALVRLDSLCDVLPGMSRADSAYCNLVRLKADLVAGRVPRSDSVALLLVDFYETELDLELLDDAYYTAAAVYYAMDNDAAAMDYLFRCMATAHGSDTLLVQRAQLMAGRIYLRNHMEGAADSLFRAVSDSAVGLLTDSLAASASAVGVDSVVRQYWSERRETEKVFKELYLEYLSGAWQYAVAVVAFVAVVAVRMYFSNLRQRMQQQQAREKYVLADGRAAADTAEEHRRMAGMEASPIYAIIRQRLNSPNERKRLSEDEWWQLSETVNTVYPGFDEKLAELCKMSTADYRLCLLIKIEVSPSAMAQILVKTSSGITSARAKLFKRAFGSNGGAAKWDDVIRSL